jgi:formylglycine-generating enzyme required for sulfatase activity
MSRLHRTLPLCLAAFALPPLAASLSSAGGPTPDAEVLDLGGGVKLELVLIQPGTFRMGSPEGEKERNPFERDFDAEQRHEVEITRPFYLGKYPVTQEQYQALTGKNPSHFSRGGDGKDRVKGLADRDLRRLPVEGIHWDDAQAFCRLLRRKTGKDCRLPTEAEWEYACRAGTSTPFHFGASLNGEQANCDGRSPYGTDRKGPYLGRTTPVGSYPPNAFGLFDMHGNVWQWCQDYYGPYGDLGKKDPLRGEKDKQERHVLRGGSWYTRAMRCRAAARLPDAPDCRDDLGFRVALSARP